MIAALSIGVLLYMLFRPETYIASMLLRLIPLRSCCSTDSFLGLVCGCYLPDFLWGFSLSCGLCALFPLKTKNVICCCLVSFLWGLMWETGQLLEVVRGTADLFDALVYLLAAYVCKLLNKKGFNYEKD